MSFQKIYMKIDIRGYLDMRYKAIVYLYRNGANLSKNRRYVIDFLFHFMRDIGVIGGVSFEKGIEYYSDVPQTTLLDEKMKNSAVTVAKIVLNEEMNHNLSGISPKYSVLKMGPTWRAPNLISALYFSVFYLRPWAQMFIASAKIQHAIIVLLLKLQTVEKNTVALIAETQQLRETIEKR